MPGWEDLPDVGSEAKPQASSWETLPDVKPAETPFPVAEPNPYIKSAKAFPIDNGPGQIEQTFTKVLNKAQDISTNAVLGTYGNDPMEGQPEYIKQGFGAEHPLNAKINKAVQPARVLGARLATMNPLVRKDRLDESPTLQKSALSLEDVPYDFQGHKLGATGAAVLQGGAEMAGMVPQMAAAAMLGPEAAPTLAAEYLHPATKFFAAGLKNVGVMGLFGAAGAPEGERASTLANTFKSPEALGLGFLGAALEVPPAELFFGKAPKVKLGTPDTDAYVPEPGTHLEAAAEAPAPVKKPWGKPAVKTLGRDTVIDEVKPSAEVKPERGTMGEKPGNAGQRNQQAVVEIPPEATHKALQEIANTPVEDAATKNRRLGRYPNPLRQDEFDLVARQAKIGWRLRTIEAEDKAQWGVPAEPPAPEEPFDPRSLQAGEKLATRTASKGLKEAATPGEPALGRPLPTEFKPIGAIIRKSLTPQLSPGGDWGGGLELLITGKGGNHKVFSLDTPAEVLRASKLIQKHNLGMPFTAPGAGNVSVDTWAALTPGVHQKAVLEALARPQGMSIQFNEHGDYVFRRVGSPEAEAAKAEVVTPKITAPDPANPEMPEGWFRNTRTMQLKMRNASTGEVSQIPSGSPDVVFRSKTDTALTKGYGGGGPYKGSPTDPSYTVGGTTTPVKEPANPPPDYHDPVQVPGIDPPQVISTHTAADITFAKNLDKNGLLEKAKKALVPTGLQGGDYLRQYVQQYESLKVGNDTRALLQKKFIKDFGVKARDALDMDLAKYAKGSIDAATMSKRYPEMWKSLQVKVDSELLKVRKFQDELIQLGVLDPKDILSRAAVEQYITREYHHFANPEAWKRIRAQEQSINTRASIASKEWWPDRDIKEAHPEITDFNAWRLSKLEQLLAEDNPNSSSYKAPPALGALKMRGTTKLIKQADGTMKEVRVDTAPWFREFLGEETSAAYSLAATQAKQAELRARAILWKDMAADPRVSAISVTDQQIAQGWKQIDPHQKNLWGDLAGRYVAPHIWDFVVDAPQHAAASRDFASVLARGLNALRKSNEVAWGGATAWFNDTVGQAQQAAMSGAWQPLNPASALEMADAQVHAALSWAEYNKNPLAETEGAQFIRDAQRLGAKGKGFNAMEGVGIDSQLRELQKHFGAQPSPLHQILTAPFRGYMKGLQAGGHAMDVYPMVQRMGAFKVLTDKALANPDLVGGVSGNLRERAMRYAADKVLSSYYTPERLAPAVDALRRSPASLPFKSYMSWKADRLTKMGLLGKRFFDPNEVEMRKSMMGMGVLVTGAYALMKYMDPTSDEEKAAMNRQASIGGSKYKNSAAFTCFHLDNGKLGCVDWAPVLEPLQYGAGDPSMPWYGRMLDNMTLGWTDDTLLGRPIRELASNIIDKRLAPPPKDQAIHPDTNDAFAAIDFAWKDLSLGPKFVPKMYNDAKASGVLGNDLGWAKPENSGSTFAMRTAGLPYQEFQPGTEKAASQVISSDAAQVFELIRRYKSIARRPPDQAAGMAREMWNAANGIKRPDEKDRAMQAVMDAIQQSTQQLGKDSQLFSKVKNKGETK